MSSGRLSHTSFVKALMAVALGLGVTTPAVARADSDNQPPRQSQAGQQSQQGIIQTQPTVREAAAQGPLTNVEEAAIRIPVDAYLRGHETGDAASFRRAFAKDARLWWVRDGQVATRTADEYITLMTGRRASDHDHRRRLVNLEIAGETAVATIEMDYPGVRLTDQLTLQKVGEEWRIVSKAFYSEPRPTVS